MHRVQLIPNRLVLVLLLVLCSLGMPGCSSDRFAEGKAAFDDGDYPTALEIWRPLADEGDAAAQNYLGKLYFEGKGTEQDLDEALRLFRLSAEQGYDQAQYNLGAAYFQGQGVEPDYSEAYLWFYLAEAQGISQASDGIAFCEENMTEEERFAAEQRAQTWELPED